VVDRTAVCQCVRMTRENSASSEWLIVLLCVKCVRMTRENSASSEMSKLLSFGYLDTSTQSPVDSRKLSAAGTRYQPSSAGPRSTHSDFMTQYQANNSLQSSAGPQSTHCNDFAMSEYQANQRPAAGSMLSSPTSASHQPAHSPAG